MSEQDEPIFKVNDRRKFNADGSVREGVTFSEEKTAPNVPENSEPRVTANEELPETDAATALAGGNLPENFISNEAAADDDDYSAPNAADEDDFDESQLPDADNPASFVNFMLSLASQAAAALGAMPHPVTGQRTLDLDLGKHWIDILGMLQEKTKGNLHEQEEKLLNGMLSDLRMQYVQVTRIAAEQMKKQAGQKFSGKDILGG